MTVTEDEDDGASEMEVVEGPSKEESHVEEEG